MKTFMPAYKSGTELEEIQLKGLQWTVKHAYGGSEVYREKLETAGVRPEDIRSLDDIKRLPFTSSNDLAEGYPFPLLSVPMTHVVRLHASSGTTGKRKVLCYTQKDIDDWAHMFARCYEMADLTPEDRVQICVGYGVWTAGVGFQLGCEKFGAVAVPAGPGNLEMQMEFLADFGSTVMCCTASMGLLLAEEVEKRGLKDRVKLKKMIYGSERSSDAMRERIRSLLNLSDMYDIPGMTELYGPGTGLECSAHDGMHYWADYYILEILDPETLEPVPDGEVGEMVVTTLRKEAVPLIRYRTRDLTAIKPQPCSCGSLLPRHDRILGRSDDMFIVRAVNIYPGQIDNVLSEVGGIGSEYQVVIDRVEGKDIMTLRVECVLDSDASVFSQKAATVKDAVRKKLLVTPEVEIVPYGSLPRSERKTKRIFDKRD
ncbi:MAG: phenylacetate--CoA ligase [Desulfomonile sp.]|jgi:phenylacetate-CoA ligase|nr:phenylacetate--CoA ligase [Deltaproteobacteria bacterium]